jgi:hypothetical protein
MVPFGLMNEGALKMLKEISLAASSMSKCFFPSMDWMDGRMNNGTDDGMDLG